MSQPLIAGDLVFSFGAAALAAAGLLVCNEVDEEALAGDEGPLFLKESTAFCQSASMLSICAATQPSSCLFLNKNVIVDGWLPCDGKNSRWVSLLLATTKSGLMMRVDGWSTIRFELLRTNLYLMSPTDTGSLCTSKAPMVW